MWHLNVSHIFPSICFCGSPLFHLRKLRLINVLEGFLQFSFSSFTRLRTPPPSRHRIFKMTGDSQVGNVLVWKNDSSRDSQNDVVLQRAAQSLRAGKLIAVPTDTIYGIAGLAQNSNAVSRIYKVKGRDLLKPIAICIDSVEAVEQWAETENLPKGLLLDFFPGPVTGVFERKTALSPELNPDTTLIGVRIPDQNFIRRLATLCGEPIALTSANKSGGESSLTVEEFADLWSEMDLIVDAGCLAPDEKSKEIARLGSTVVDLSMTGYFRIIRPGSAYESTVGILTSYGLKESRRS